MTAITNSHHVCDLRGAPIAAFPIRAGMLCFGFDPVAFSTQSRIGEHIWNVTTVTYLCDVLHLL